MFIFDAEMGVAEIIDGALFAIRWSGQESHVLDEMAEKLSDVMFLNDYFESNRARLNYFQVTPEDAVLKTAK